MNFKKRVNGSWTDTPHYIHKTSTDTLTTLPAVLYPTGTTATVGLKGQTLQSSTPSPTSPVMPQGTGERTGNLLNPNITRYEKAYSDRIVDFSGGAMYIVPIKSNTTYTVKTYSDESIGVFRIGLYNKPVPESGDTVENIVQKSGSNPTATITNTDYKYLMIQISGAYIDNYGLADTVLNEGSEPLPYEPYGIKIPISSASTTTPVYLGEVETTRKIKKLVLTGEEGWINNSNNACCVLYINPIGAFREYNPLIICSHVPTASTQGNLYNRQVDYGITFGGSSADRICIRNKDCEPVADFKNWLRQQYAAGTPVTVWYVLATEETGIVNEPLMKIGEYADTVSGITIPVTAGGDTLSVDTTVQPSEVTVNYKGWHPVADVHERDNGAWT